MNFTLKKMAILQMGFLMFLSTGCGIPHDLADHLFLDKGQKRVYEASNPVFASYVTTFEETAKAELSDEDFQTGIIPINFHDVSGNKIGACLEYSNSTREIFIKKKWWDKATEQMRQILIFHELGHCRLGRDHDDSTISNSEGVYNTSLMSTVLMSSSDYEKFQEYFDHELFTLEKETLTEAVMNAAPSEE